MQTEKPQLSGQRILPKSRLTSFLALSVYPRVRIPRSTSGTDDRFYLFPSSLKLTPISKIKIWFCTALRSAPPYHEKIMPAISKYLSSTIYSIINLKTGRQMVLIWMRWLIKRSLARIYVACKFYHFRLCCFKFYAKNWTANINLHKRQESDWWLMYLEEGHVHRWPEHSAQSVLQDDVTLHESPYAISERQIMI